MALVILVAPAIIVARLPREHAHTILFIVLVAALVHVAGLVIESLLPLSFAVLEPVLELADVNAQVLPLVLALPLRLALVIGACEAVSIGEDI